VLDDAAAIARAQEGDLDAYELLVARYSAPAHRLARLLGVGAEAEDVVQDAFVKAYRHLGGFRTGLAFRPWILRIVANEAKNTLRSRGRRAELELRLASTGPGLPLPVDPASRTVEHERRARLLAAVRLLPGKEREAVVCRYFLELSEAETAQVLGWPRGSVKSRTFRALARLRGVLGDLEEVTHD
jgi:RNA polymerase sigma factor (sigma-70 family)